MKALTLENIKNSPMNFFFQLSFTLPLDVHSGQNPVKKKEFRNKVKKDIKRRKLKNKAAQLFKKEIGVYLNIQKGEYYWTTDLDNLIKTVLDGLKGLVFDDDKQVKTLVVEKSKVKKETSMVFVGIWIKQENMPNNVLYEGSNICPYVWPKNKDHCVLTNVKTERIIK